MNKIKIKNDQLLVVSGHIDFYSGKLKLKLLVRIGKLSSNLKLQTVANWL